MKSLVILLTAVLALKLVVGEWNWHVAVEDALVSAYGAKAADACRGEAKARGFPPAQPLSRPGEVRLSVGAGDLDVWFWDIGNASWGKRYRTPHLRLSMQSGEAWLQCSYDVAHKVAVVSR